MTENTIRVRLARSAAIIAIGTDRQDNNPRGRASRSGTEARKPTTDAVAHSRRARRTTYRAH
jgi:hypothetical protein